jgi:two-component system, cell cycle response regulator DivK
VDNIIVVEDDPFSQEFYRYLLKREGYTPLIIEEGDLLFKQLQMESISLIIMDINLKNTYLNNEKVDGVILSKMVKENPAYSKVPVLLVTAYSLVTDGPGFFEESLAEDYITKPIMDYNLLLKKIKNLVEG